MRILLADFFSQKASKRRIELTSSSSEVPLYLKNVGNSTGRHLRHQWQATTEFNGASPMYEDVVLLQPEHLSDTYSIENGDKATSTRGVERGRFMKKIVAHHHYHHYHHYYHPQVLNKSFAKDEGQNGAPSTKHCMRSGAKNSVLCRYALKPPIP